MQLEQVGVDYPFEKVQYSQSSKYGRSLSVTLYKGKLTEL